MHRRVGRAGVALLFVLAGAGVCAAQPPAVVAATPAVVTGPPAVPSVKAVRATSRIVIDGRLDEADWQRAEPAAGFTQRNPDEGKPATERTEVRVLYDADAIYFGARMFDREAGKIARRLTRRDEDSSGIADTLIIGLDPHHDHVTGARFAVSAAGSLRDGTLLNDSSDDNSWDGVWEAAVAIDDLGWTAEIRIPFSQLRFPAADRQTWGLNVVRSITRTNEEDWWAPTPKKDSAIVSRFGHLEGLDGIRGRRHLDLLPYATAKGERNSTVDAANPFTSGHTVTPHVGVDAKWGVSSNVTVDATVNPDFGQVEVDPAVVNLSAFETFYDEKRPFFIEGSDVFNRFGRNGASGFMGFNRSNPTLFYSRRIGRAPQDSASGDFVDAPTATTILGAAKITGKTTSGWTFNLTEALTAAEWADVADGAARSRVEIEPATNYLAARVYRDIGTRAGIGMLATLVNRDTPDTALRDRVVDHAYVVGVDGHAYLNSGRDFVIAGALSASRVEGTEAAISRLERASARYFQRPDAAHLRYDPLATALTGWNLQIDFNRNTGNVRPNVSYWAVSPGYETNDVGYLTSADRMGMHAGVVWLTTTPDSFSRSRHLVAAKWYVWNFAHEKMSDGVYIGGSATFRNYWSGSVTLIATADPLNDRLTRGGPMMKSPGGRSYGASLGSDGRKIIGVNINGNYSIDSAGSWDSSGAVTIAAKPVPALTVEIGPSLLRSLSLAQYVTTAFDASATATFGRRDVFGEIDQIEWSMTTRVSLMMNPRMSFQMFAQPLLSVGRYGHFKQAAKPRTYTFLRYGVDVGTIGFDPASDTYHVNPTGDATGVPFSFGDPNFNFKSLRVNAVYRWEFRPGSTFFLVWTQQREDYVRPGQFAFGTDLSSLVHAPADNVVLAKVSYWFSR
ncbi:MAG: DUF5916 domain-containing protein [Acidobacteriota bacterium]